jgi:inner membrane transporter RhtA
VSLVLIGILSVQFGAAVSKGLFGEIPPVGMVLLRLVTSSLILLALARPRLGGRTAADWRPVLALGVALGAMNWAFYESFARIPLGVAVTIEFVGPLVLAAVGRRRPRDLVWVGLAALGVVLFGAGPTKVDALGFGLALLAGGCWALYIVSTAPLGAAGPASRGWRWPARWRLLPSRRSPWRRRARACLSHACWCWGLWSVCSVR